MFIALETNILILSFTVKLLSSLIQTTNYKIRKNDYIFGKILRRVLHNKNIFNPSFQHNKLIYIFLKI
jgi:hypothetical protein